MTKSRDGCWSGSRWDPISTRKRYGRGHLAMLRAATRCTGNGLCSELRCKKTPVLLNPHVVLGISGIKTAFIHAAVARIMRTPHKCDNRSPILVKKVDQPLIFCSSPNHGGGIFPASIGIFYRCVHLTFKIALNLQDGVEVRTVTGGRPSFSAFKLNSSVTDGSKQMTDLLASPAKTYRKP